MDLRERVDLPGLDPRRADISVAGCVLLDTLLRMLEADEITLCDLALREGLILDYISQHQSQIVQIDQYPDIRRRSVLELGERCHYWSPHTAQVARLALSLFDQTTALHGADARAREWLEYGALLHDVGVHISYENHHRHSHYLIRHGDLRGFEPEEVEVIGLIARYHRRGTPKKSDGRFASLRRPLRKAVRALSAFTTVAEGLDRSHAQVISKLDVIDRQADVVIRLHCAADAELELWAAQRHLGPLEKLLGKPIRLEATMAPPAGDAAGASAESGATTAPPPAADMPPGSAPASAGRDGNPRTARTRRSPRARRAS
jgi:exopolyphosphatase/guanosine-5'-triphosphate,3'-diphosphate pyrophosphatase